MVHAVLFLSALKPNLFPDFQAVLEMQCLLATKKTIFLET